jgi:pSer/pThr/pTyr-binding forkhead associated (FHA) protein
MPTLTLKFRDEVLREFPIERGGSATIGRLDANAIVIDNLSVSGHHAKIDSVGDGYLLVDLQSKNGSFVNDKPVTTHWLSDGDVIRIGKHTLAFTIAPGESHGGGGQPAADRTMVIQTATFADGPSSGPAPKEVEPVGVLAYLAGGDGDIELVKKLTTIGKDRAADIRVSGWTVGRTAATISRRPNGYYLSHVGGLTRPRINGQTVRESAPLNEFDIVEIGPVKLQFFTRE